MSSHSVLDEAPRSISNDSSSGAGGVVWAEPVGAGAALGVAAGAGGWCVFAVWGGTARSLGLFVAERGEAQANAKSAMETLTLAKLGVRAETSFMRCRG